ncbi:MAG: hypothetical protein PHT59_06310 [Candidatus Omnitrophica bacterium]|nr:hypothetical protein [Candidatus Omnitrophota bacterium]
MTKTLLIILMRTRRQSAVRVQKVLTDFGCMIKTRLGIHDGVLDRCSDVGLVLLEIVGPKQEKRKLDRKLKAIAGVKTKLVDISL